MLWLIACTLPETEPMPAPDGAVSAADLWQDELEDGQRATLAPVVVVSPRTTSRRFYVQDPMGGPGVEVALYGLLPHWPPEVGAVVEITGRVRPGSPPLIELEDHEDARVIGSATPVSMEWDAARSPIAELVWVDTVITSTQDPLGFADTAAGARFDGRSFGLEAPGWLAQGTLSGVALDGRIAPRDATDWTGETDGAPPLETSISQLGSLEEGTPVLVRGTRATPWSLDGRWTVIQDDAAAGVWVDAEAFGLQGGDGRSDWWAEIRGDHLRTWVEAEFVEAADPITSPDPVDGSLVQITVSELGEPDLFGDRTSQDWLLDARFADLASLPDPVEITAVVREGDPARLCPLSW